MTSKEAFSIIFDDLIPMPSYLSKEDKRLVWDAMDKIKKDLELLELIKEKAVNVARLYYAIYERKGLEYYNSFATIENYDKLTRKEYKLLKEWLNEGISKNK